MVGKMVGFVCCLLCAFPFFIVGKFNKESAEPINFWSGDKNLKGKIKDVRGYNEEMSKLYSYCALTFIVIGLICFVHAAAAGICIGLVCTLGIYIAWKRYKTIFAKYS